MERSQQFVGTTASSSVPVDFLLNEQFMLVCISARTLNVFMN